MDQIKYKEIKQVQFKKGNEKIYSFILQKRFTPDMFNGIKMIEQIIDFVRNEAEKGRYYSMKFIDGLFYIFEGSERDHIENLLIKEEVEGYDDDDGAELAVIKEIKIVIRKNGWLYNIGNTVNGDLRMLKKMVKENLYKAYMDEDAERAINELFEDDEEPKREYSKKVFNNKVDRAWDLIKKRYTNIQNRAEGQKAKEYKFSPNRFDKSPCIIELYKQYLWLSKLVYGNNSQTVVGDAIRAGGYNHIDLVEIKNMSAEEKRTYRTCLNLLLRQDDKKLLEKVKEYDLIAKQAKDEELMKYMNENMGGNKRTHRGGIDNLNLYIEEYEDDKIYVPKNLKCLYSCLEKALTKEYIEGKIEEYLNQESELTENSKNRIIDILYSNELKNNTIKQGKEMFITPLEEIAKMLKVEIQIKSYNREKKEITAESVYNKGKGKKIRILDYEIKMINLKENKKIICPVINSEKVIEENFKGKHVILIKTPKYETKVIEEYLKIKGDFEIINFSDTRIDENAVNNAIKNSLKKLSKRKEEEEQDEDEEEASKYINNRNVFAFDIETTVDQTKGHTHFKKVAEKCERRVNKEGFYEIDLKEEDEEKMYELGKKAVLDTIQVLSIKELEKKENGEYEIGAKSVKIFQKTKECDETRTIENFIEYIVRNTEIKEMVTKKGNKYYKKEATVIGYNSSKFDLDVILENINGIKSIMPKKQINTGGGLICFSLEHIKIVNNKPIKTTITFIDMQRLLGGLSLKNQCKNFNVQSKYAKLEINSITKIKYEQLKSYGEQNLLFFEKRLIEEYEKTDSVERKSKIEELMHLTITTLMQLTPEQRRRRIYQMNGKNVNLEKLLETYDQNDVISLLIIFDKYYNLIKNVLKIELKKNFTAAGIAGNYLKDRIDPDYRYISNKEINWNIFDKAIYGGICFSRVNKFETSKASREKLEKIVFEKGVTQEEIIRVVKENDIEDIIRAIDYNGLYGSAFLMDYNWASDTEIPKFIKDDLNYLEDLKNKLNNKEELIFGGYICAQISVPKNITIPILINKDKDGNLVYSNEDKNHNDVYTIQTLQNAIKYNNVKIEKIHYILKYESKTKLLVDFASSLLYNRLCYKLAIKLLKKDKENVKILPELVNNEIKKQFKIFEENIKDDFTKIEMEKCKKYFIKENVELFGWSENIDISSYSDLCSQLEQLFKLIANSMYGKTLEKPRFTSSKIMKCTECKKCCTHFDNISKPIINGFVIVETIDLKQQIKTSRDIGAHVLSNSKEIVYNGMNIVDGFFTNNILYTDTDSFYCKEPELIKIEKSGLTNNFLPFCLKTNEVELVKDKFSYITSLYSTGQKNKCMEGYYLEDKTDCPRFVKSTNAKFTMKGFKAYLKEDAMQLNEIIIEQLTKGVDLDVCYTYLKEEVQMSSNEIKDLCTNKKQYVEKTLRSWKRELGCGVIINEIMTRKLKCDANEQKYTIIKENGIMYRYPLHYSALL